MGCGNVVAGGKGVATDPLMVPPLLSMLRRVGACVTPAIEVIRLASSVHCRMQSESLAYRK